MQRRETFCAKALQVITASTSRPLYGCGTTSTPEPTIQCFVSVYCPQTPGARAKQGRVQETAPTQREKQKQRRRISSKQQAIHSFGRDQALQCITSSKSHAASPTNRIMERSSTAYTNRCSCSSGGNKHTAADAIDQLVTSAGRWNLRQLRRALWRALKIHLVWVNWQCTATGGPSCSPLINVPEGDVTALWKMLGQGPTRRQQPFRRSGTVVVISFDSRRRPTPSRRKGAGTCRLMTLFSSDPRPHLVLHDVACPQESEQQQNARLKGFP